MGDLRELNVTNVDMEEIRKLIDGEPSYYTDWWGDKPLQILIRVFNAAHELNDKLRAVEAERDAFDKECDDKEAEIQALIGRCDAAERSCGVLEILLRDVIQFLPDSVSAPLALKRDAAKQALAAGEAG